MKVIATLETRAEKNGDKRLWCLFICEHCGQHVERRKSLGEKQKSCGCIRTKHGAHKTKLYAVWASMLSRCKDVKNPYYGGKGISVCAAWKEFGEFRLWACLNGYTEGFYIDRRDNSLGYFPENCRWVNPLVSGENRGTTKIQLSDVPSIKAQCRSGTKRKTIAAQYGVKGHTISQIYTGKRRVADGRKGEK
jgi:hypothetical protein